MLSFPITIRPDEEGFGVLGLIFNVLGDVFLVLVEALAQSQPRPGQGSATYIRYRSHNAGIEQGNRWRVFPILIARFKVDTCEMAHDGCHGHLTEAPRMTKVKLKAVVLDILIASVALQRHGQ